MIDIFLITKQGIYDIPVESVTWKGSKFNAARSIEVTLPTVRRAYLDTIFPENGEGVVFKWKGQELFQGTVFTNTDTKNGMGKFTAYDKLIYLLKSEDSRIITKKKASDVVRMFCTELKLPIGNITDTKYVIPSHVMDGDSYYDTIIKYLVETYKRTGIKYYLYSMNGKINLIKRTENPHKWILENGTNITDWTYEKSIDTDNFATRVKLQSGEENQTITAIANNGSAQGEWGIIQHYERVPDKLNKAQLQAKADQMLKNKAKEEIKFDLDAVGIPDVISGGSCYVLLKEIGIAKGYYIDEDSHTFQGNKHIMSLKLEETDDLPKVDGVKPYEPRQEARAKASGGKTKNVSDSGRGYNSEAAKWVRAKVKEMGLTITSAYRSSKHNAEVNGSPTSKHLSGRAYDVAGSVAKMDVFAEAARESGLFNNVLWRVKGHFDHVHVDW
jgi:hypothetical protein